MPLWLSPWDWSAADWAGLQFVILVIAAIVAWRQVREALRLREEQARPFVIIELEPRDTIGEFKITNVGSTIARDVRFTFNPPLSSTWDSQQGHVPLLETSLFKNGIPSLAPGATIRALFDQFPDRIQKGFPSDYDVTVSYTDARGKRHHERMIVGYGHLVEVGRIHRRDLTDIYKQLETIAKEVKKWTVLGSAIRVMTRDEVKQYHRELEERRDLPGEERHAQQTEANGTSTASDGG